MSDDEGYRYIEIKRGDVWEKAAFEAARPGDTIRIYDSDGTLVWEGVTSMGATEDADGIWTIGIQR